MERKKDQYLKSGEKVAQGQSFLADQCNLKIICLEYIRS